VGLSQGFLLIKRQADGLSEDPFFILCYQIRLISENNEWFNFTHELGLLTDKL
jgi:hypothetical protein